MERNKKKLPTTKNKKRQLSKDDVTLVPGTEVLLMEAESLLGNELARLKSVQQQEGEGLSSKDLKSLHSCIESTIKISKEKRELSRELDLENMSEDELLALVEGEDS